LAWIANKIASLDLSLGRPDIAEQVLQQADTVFPHYPYTLQNLAQVRLAQHQPLQAIALLEQRQQLAPSPHTLYALGRAQSRAGHTGDAAATFARFVEAAEAQASMPANANLELINYYAGQPKTAADALKLAQREAARRHDVYTLDALALALYVNGIYVEADVPMQRALAVGIRSAQLFAHAGDIASKLNRHAEAARDYQSSLDADTSSEYADAAHKALASLAPTLPAAPPIPAPAGEQQSEGPRIVPSTVEPASNAGKASFPTVAPSPQASSHPAGQPEQFAQVPISLLTPKPTGTEQAIRTMQARITHSPKEAASYAGLGAAFFQRARETGNVDDYAMAEKALKTSLSLVSDDLSATAPLTTMAEVCMGEHRFSAALAYAQKALSFGSGDLSAFAIVGDAYADMGEYEQASAAYSRLQATDEDHASASRIAYVRDTRISYLKFILGDTDQAIRLMQSAVQTGLQARLPRESLAWLYFELGEYSSQAGRAQDAHQAYLAALTIHPGDYRAIAGLGKLLADQGVYAEAITLYKRAIAVVPMPIYIAELGDLYTKIGNTAEAEKQYKLVEFIGRLGHINQVLHNRDLALFYADHNRSLAESLTLAHKEFEVRHDVYTWDALAWALYKNGKLKDAQAAMEHALGNGTKDAMLLFHAGMISARLGQNARAKQQLEMAIRINPRFHVIYSDMATQQLALLGLQLKLTASDEGNYAR
jgi:tetratricopeptide (TPR) repeat protein